MKFFPSSKINIDTTKEWLSIPIMDSTMTVAITTPRGWKCKRRRCNLEMYHSHTTYPALSKETNEKETR